MSKLAGKVALVTGASRGIGRACAIELAAQGAAVGIAYRENEEGARETASLCLTAHVVQLDVRDAQQVASGFDEVERVLGPVQILVNNAGITQDRLLSMMSEADWQKVIDTNLTGVFRCTKRALRRMLSLRWGRVVNIGSIIGTIGNRGQTNYAASKSALTGLTKALSRELAGRGITCNLVAPGFVNTDATAGMPDALKSMMLHFIPAGRAGCPNDIAEAVLFCVTSEYLNGQVITIDGGLS